MSDLLRATLTYEIDGDPNSVLRAAAEEAFAVVAAELTGRFNDAISGAYWPWPDDTPRWGNGGGRTLEEAADNWNTWINGNGTGKRPRAVAGSPRSVVDSGDLKQSLTFTLNRAAMEANWTWNAEYAAAVHEGAYIHPFQNPDKVVELPARPWTKAVLEGGTGAVGIEVYDAAARLQSLIEVDLDRL